MGILGYIVQYSDEEEYTIYHGFQRLYPVFSHALEHAKEVYRNYLVTHEERYDGPFEAYNPQKKECDAQGSSVVFKSPTMIIWIDAIIG